MKITSKLFLTMTTALSMVSFSAMAMDDEKSSSSISHPAPLIGTLNGVGALTQDGRGTLTLSRNNTYSGSTTLTAGTLTLSNDASNTGRIIVKAGRVLQVSQQRYDEIKDRLEVEDGGTVEIKD